MTILSKNSLTNAQVKSQKSISDNKVGQSKSPENKTDGSFSIGTQNALKTNRNHKRKRVSGVSNKVNNEETSNVIENKIVSTSNYSKAEIESSSVNDTQTANKKRKSHKRKSKDSQVHLDDNEVLDSTAAKKIKVDSKKLSLGVKSLTPKTKNGAAFLNGTQTNLQCIEYLKKWENDKKNWKFEKLVQRRLITIMFDEDKLPEKYFQTFLDYMAGGSPSIKKIVKNLAGEIISSMEKWNSLNEIEKKSTPNVEESKYNRARNLMQHLQ